MDQDTTRGVLDGIALFEHFTPAERDVLATYGHIIETGSGVVLLREGDEAHALYLLLEGEVRVLGHDAAGNAVELARRGAGQCFGEMALIDGGRRSATVETTVPCRLFVLERRAFATVVSPAPQLMGKLLRDLSHKIREASERLVREDLDGRMRAAEAELARHRAIVQAVTGLAHELNTPLGVCVTAASHIESLAAPGAVPGAAPGGSSGGGEALHEAAALLRENLARVVTLVEAFTAIAATHNAGPPEPHDLAELCRHAAALHTVQRPAPRLEVTVAADGPCPWHGHRDHLERVLAELLGNVAAHAYPPGAGGAVEIAVADAALGSRAAWAVTVRDRGAGLDPAALPKLFDAFYTTARGRGHKGLGLTIVYNTVTGPLAGRVQVAGAPGAGMAVTLTLPREP